MTSTTLLLLLHTASTLGMTGVIWFVQAVHYPLFAYAEGPAFRDFAAAHQRRTGWVVVPLMLTEATTATLLLLSALASWIAWLGWVLLVVIWLSTALVQVPLHRRLSTGFDATAARRLVVTNWWRTIPWSLRSALALYLVFHGGR